MGAFGKQRRTVNADDLDEAFDAEAGIGSFCDPLVGIKAGVEFLVTPNVMIAPAVGVAINLDESDRSGMFVDGEINYVFDNGAYLGTGLGVWDVFDDATLNLLVNFGVPMSRYDNGQARLLFVVEGRLFFDEFDNIENNYQFWGGLRFRF
jgi:hypothetical protein